MATDPTTTTPELAYRVPGKGTWKRRTFTSQAKAQAFVDRLLETEGDDVELRWAD